MAFHKPKFCPQKYVFPLHRLRIFTAMFTASSHASSDPWSSACRSVRPGESSITRVHVSAVGLSAAVILKPKLEKMDSGVGHPIGQVNEHRRAQPRSEKAWKELSVPPCPAPAAAPCSGLKYTVINAAGLSLRALGWFETYNRPPYGLHMGRAQRPSSQLTSSSADQSARPRHRSIDGATYGTRYMITPGAVAHSQLVGGF